MSSAIELASPFAAPKVMTPPPTNRIRVLIVDDESKLVDSLRRTLKSEFEVFGVTSGAEGIRALETQRFDIVLTDMQMPEVDGFDVLRRARTLSPSVPVIVMTAFGDVTTAVAAMKGGASDFIPKPLDTKHLSRLINVVHRPRPEASSSRLVGSSDWLEPFNNVLTRIATSNKSVLLVGETGTGKSLVAKEIARMSGRPGRFVEINCAAIPETLIELKLFGSVPGAFTDARNLEGVLEAAEGGTLFLDEIGELNYDVQAKLLRVLQEKTYSRLGSTVDQKATCRIIVATNRNLEEAIEKRQFRADLYYRLNVINVEIPPLRNRAQDVPSLFEHYRRESDDPVPPLSRAAMNVLQTYVWPGNVRELRNVVERLSVIADPNKEVTPEDLEAQLGIRPSHNISPQLAPIVLPGAQTGDFTTDLEGQSLEEAVNGYQRAIIVGSLKRNGGNMSKTSRDLDIVRTTLIERCRKLNIGRDDWDGDDSEDSHN